MEQTQPIETVKIRLQCDNCVHYNPALSGAPLNTSCNINMRNENNTCKDISKHKYKIPMADFIDVTVVIYKDPLAHAIINADDIVWLWNKVITFEPPPGHESGCLGVTGCTINVEYGIILTAEVYNVYYLRGIRPDEEILESVRKLLMDEIGNELINRLQSNIENPEAKDNPNWKPVKD